MCLWHALSRLLSASPKILDVYCIAVRVSSLWHTHVNMYDACSQRVVMFSLSRSQTDVDISRTNYKPGSCIYVTWRHSRQAAGKSTTRPQSRMSAGVFQGERLSSIRPPPARNVYKTHIAFPASRVTRDMWQSTVRLRIVIIALRVSQTSIYKGTIHCTK